MKFFPAVAALSAFLAGVSAQSINIGYPQDGATVQAGSNLTVEIDRPNTLSGSTEIAVVIGVQSCASSPCHSPADGLGNILYNGGYKPQYNQPPDSKPPHQNFTVTIPSTLAKGKALLGVAHMTLIGAGAAPILETRNITLNVV
ncbi:hypothetical protein LshimejAT787_1001510 [Lyophyllum shimeji]|uniref:Uncharacterized protein n=1 Tax=Lyophyllum shimeji TaxID=47721 RepID=A0A9P3PUM3_LYOSH|nr:hypothetical protein LshimejAT787_1001510 [Lyophyllum shimeji]